ncbi:MAG: hypothetical protein GKR95_11725 [Gammaproteobacteria bacterium]|nr:hypothetical protein [Gammaproteobacteria bacterium]NKB62747.1 hypothetical protein [Gammaproteobacteria bacterium]
MNILTIITHPIQSSFNHALLENVVKGLEQSNHTVDISDLYAENFQCAMTDADFAQFHNKPMPKDVLAFQKRVEWSDGLVFIFPIWWWSVPAMLKGWIDRVISYGWAWSDPLNPDSGFLKERKILVLATAGASKAALAKRKYDESLHTQLNVGTWGYCGFRDITTHFYYELHSETPLTRRQSYLDHAQQLGSTVFSSPDS